MGPLGWRRLWNGHLWLGVGLLLPLVWWMGTAVAFAIWPLDQVRGRALSSGQKAVSVPLKAGMVPPPDLVEGARMVSIRTVEGHPISVVHREEGLIVWDLEGRRSLGPAIPMDWALAAAKRDFKGDFLPRTIIFYRQDGRGETLKGDGEKEWAPSTEYPGPFPAYAFHLDQGPSMHLYVDGLTGEVKARRSGVWRFYDWCFRLHSLDIVGDGTKRGVILAASGLWFALGITGSAMAWRKLRRRTG